jgi:polysaccharide export outer membrane protein
MKKPVLILILGSLFFALNMQPERFEQSAAAERLERFEQFFALVGSFSESTVWAQDSQPGGSVQVPSNYTIGQGDNLEIFVWRNEQLSRQVVVRPDGKISLPLLQDVQAEGLTVLSLKEELTRRLGEYLENPRVTVIVNQISSYRVSVLGRVVRPGVYPITGDTTLIEAISMAGGFTEWANKRKITVITSEMGAEKKIVINYNKIASGRDPSHNIVLKRGDTIIVP